jgi:hypothetical protein
LKYKHKLYHTKCRYRTEIAKLETISVAFNNFGSVAIMFAGFLNQKPLNAPFKLTSVKDQIS